MRFRRLDLAFYGRFTGFALDFGAAPEDGADLHLVYGPNEAGKSTILSGMIEFLFGMAPQTPYNFLHSYETLRIDGDIEVDGGALALTRVKRAKRSLLDEAGQPVPDSAIGRAADLGRVGYEAMFSLNDDSLKAGAADLLAAKGDFGEILFGAAAGLGRIGEKLDEMRAEADAIHRLRAQKTELQDLRREIDDLDKRRAAADLTASRYEALQADRDRAAEAATAAADEEKTAREALARLERLAGGLDAYAGLLEARAKLAGLAETPAPKLGWPEKAEALAREEQAVASRLTDAEAALKKLEVAAKSIVRDPDVLALMDRIEALDPARYKTAADDLPKRRQEAEATATAAAEIARRLGRPDATPEALLIPAPTRSRIAALLNAWTKLTATLASAEAAEVDARADADGATALDGAARAALSTATDAARRSTSRADAAVAARQAAEQERLLEQALGRLAPWRGDVEALTRLAAPSSETLARWRDGRNAHDDNVRRFRDAERRLQTERRQLVDRIAAAQAAAGDAVPDEDAFRTLRASRDAAWDAHLAKLDSETAATFAEHMATLDAATDARLGDTETAAVLSKLSDDLKHTDDEIAETARLAKAAAADFEPTAAAIAAVAEVLGLPAEIPLDDLADWLARRTAALEIGDKAQAERAREAGASAEAKDVAARLQTALGATGVAAPEDADVDVLQHLAGEVLQGAEIATRQARAQERAAGAVAEAKRRLEEWRREWKIALDGTWLAEFIDAPDAVAGALEALTELSATAARQNDLSGRIVAMTDDMAAYDKEATAIATALDMDASGEAPAVGRALSQRLEDARAAERDHAKLEADIAAMTEDLAGRRAAAEAHAAAIHEMAAHFGVEDVAGVLDAIERHSDRAALAETIAGHERDVRRAAGNPNLAEAEAALSELTPDSLAAEQAQLEETVEALRAASQEAHHTLRNAEAEVASLAGDADAAALAQARETKLLEMTDAARRHLKLKLGVMASERALDRYRQSHRSGMLDRASEAFAQVTRGSFTGLTTQPGRDGERLVALRPEGSATLDDKAMSTATRAQLYLALRIAGYAEFARRGDPPPFIADDIIETFDNERAVETLSVLGDMARTGQVIYFTHHAHLVEIARAAAPGVTVHELPDPVAS